MKTGTIYNEEGLDIRGFNKDGFYKQTGKLFDRFGFD